MISKITNFFAVIGFVAVIACSTAAVATQVTENVGPYRFHVGSNGIYVFDTVTGEIALREFNRIEFDTWTQGFSTDLDYPIN